MTPELDHTLDLLNALRFGWQDAIAHDDILAAEVLAPLLDLAEARWVRICEAEWSAATASGECEPWCAFRPTLN